MKLEPTGRSSSKKPGVAFWASVMVLCIVVAYPLSYGAWHYARGRFGREMTRSYAWPFIPLGFITDNGPRILVDPYREFLLWCVRRGKDDARK